MSSPRLSLKGDGEARFDLELLEEPRLTLGDLASPKRAEDEASSFPDIQILYQLWQSTGKSVNLWDWLDGFRRNMASVNQSVSTEDSSMGMCEEEAHRLHSKFVRFVEESRLLGAIRSRGKGRNNGGDEVAKGVVIV